MKKAGAPRPVVFPKKKGLKEDIALNVARLLGLNRKEFEKQLAELK